MELSPQAQQALILCLQTAKSSGVPIDQAQRFISLGYIPLPWQWHFHSAARIADKEGGPVDIGCGGARGPGKSHCVLSQVGLDDCQRVEGLKILFLRQTGNAARESFADLIDKTLKGRVSYEFSTNVLKFKNGSRILMGGFQDENDIDKYVGIEYDIIIVEELNQLTTDKYQKLRGSLRTSKPNWRPRMYTSFNPGGKGHAFVKDRYVMPFREQRQKDTFFVPSTYKSNPHLNREYIDYLESLEGDLGKAWREGEWDLFAGQYFDEYRNSLHSCPPFIPKPSLEFIGGMDWGRSAPFSFHLSCIKHVKYEGTVFSRLFTFLEVYGTEKKPSEWAEIITKKLEFYHLTPDMISIWGDPAMFSKGQDMSLSIADQFQRSGVHIKRANNDRLSRWVLMHNWLSLAPDGIPYWVITSNCVNLHRTIPLMIHDEHDIEDLDTTLEDHAVDSSGYAMKHMKWIDAREEMRKMKKANFEYTPDGHLTSGLKSDDFAIAINQKRGVYI